MLRIGVVATDIEAVLAARGNPAERIINRGNGVRVVPSPPAPAFTFTNNAKSSLMQAAAVPALGSALASHPAGAAASPVAPPSVELGAFAAALS